MPDVDQRILTRLPHQHPFRFVTRLTEYVPGERARGVWVVTGDEGFLQGHFPGTPMVPGVLISEALAQLAGIVGLAADDATPPVEGRLAHLDMRFTQAVTPPADIELHATLIRAMGGLCQCDVRAMVGDAVVARGTVVIAAGNRGASP